jgi:hypothetical protein
MDGYEIAQMDQTTTARTFDEARQIALVCSQSIHSHDHWWEVTVANLTRPLFLFRHLLKYPARAVDPLACRIAPSTDSTNSSCEPAKF